MLAISNKYIENIKITGHSITQDYLIREKKLPTISQKASVEFGRMFPGRQLSYYYVRLHCGFVGCLNQLDLQQLASPLGSLCMELLVFVLVTQTMIS